jgi:large subunit ribosomal protein L10
MRPEKKSMSVELKTKVSGSGYVILTDHTGLTVAKTAELRKRLKGANAKVQVVKNRVFKHVLEEAGVNGLDPALKGASAMVFGSGDVVAAAKVLKDFFKENEKPVVKMGTLQGQLLSRADVDSLAALPSREVMLGKLVGTIAAPLSQLVGVLNQKVSTVVYVLSAVKDKKEKAA